MHRTEADGSAAGEYVDEALPGTAGTLLVAVDRNTVQEEIAAVVERAGLSLKTVATETNDQLETVIFDTYIERTAAMRTSGPTHTNDMSASEIDIVETGTDNRARVQTSGISASSSAGTTAIKPLGVEYQTVGTVNVKEFDASGLDWTVDADTGRIYYLSSGTLLLTGILAAARVLQASVLWTHPTFGKYSAPLFGLYVDDGGTLRLTSGCVLGLNPKMSSATGQTLIVWYEQ